jgi:hypothetical protein
MDSEDEEKCDDDIIDKPVEIIKVDEEYEMKNELVGVKLDVILKLTTSIIGEHEMKKLFFIGKEMSVFKDTKLSKMLRYFPPILQIKHGHPQQDYEDYEIRGNQTFVSKDFMK